MIFLFFPFVLYAFGAIDLYNGLQAYFPLQGDVKDYSGNGLNGYDDDLTNQLPLLSNIYGEEDTCYRWNRLDDSNLRVGTTSDLNFNDIGVSFWIKLLSIPSGSSYGAYSKDADTCCYKCYFPAVSTQITCAAHIGSLWEEVTSTTEFELNRWYHVVHTCGSSRCDLYINKEEEDSNSNGGVGINQNTNGYFRIGSLTSAVGNLDELDGSIMEFRVYDRLLNNVEVEYLYWKDAPMERHLRGYYPLNEEKAYDGSKFHHDGTISNSGGAVTGHAGFADSALVFDGSDTYVTLGQSVCDFSALGVENQGMTVAAFVKPDSLTTNRVVISKRDDPATNTEGFVLGVNSTCYFSKVVLGASDRRSVDTDTLVQDCSSGVTTTAWVHLAVTFDGSTLTLYRDGEVVDSVPDPGPLNDYSGECVIGGYSVSASDRFSGLIEDVYVFSRGLSSSEIRKLYFGDTLELGLIGHYDFEGEVVDKSAQNTSIAFPPNIVGDPIYIEDRHGNPNSSMYLNGVEYVGLGTNLYNIDYPSTVAVWSKNDYTSAPGSAVAVLCKNRLDTGFMDYGIYWEDGKGKIFADDGSPKRVTSDKVVFVGEYNFFAFIFDGDTLHMVLNNETASYAGTFGTLDCSSTKSLTVGSCPTNRNLYRGKFDEVRVYRRVLSTSELKLLSENWECFGTSHYETLLKDTVRICSGYGWCASLDYCRCEENYYESTSDCNRTTCDSVFSNQTDIVCTGRGKCWPYETCSCDSLYFGDNCNVTKCFGLYSNDTQEVCSVHGRCWPYDTCSCDTDFYGETCNITKCFDYFSNDTENVCSGYGDCTKPDNCSCFDGYNGSVCEEFYCFGVHWSEENREMICHGHGNCSSPDLCDCQGSGYSDNDCGTWVCYNVSNQDLSNICRGHGECIEIDDCNCTTGYTGNDCSEYFCGDYPHFDDRVCSSNGECTAFMKCTCFEQYYFVISTQECIHCPDGRHSDETGAVGIESCEICPLGTYSTNETDGCLVCPKGSFSNEERTNCVECPKGTYNQDLQSGDISSCLDCPKGFFGPNTGQTSLFDCLPCPYGTKSEVEGLTDETGCLQCSDSEECPLGTSSSFDIDSTLLDENKIFYQDDGVNLEAGEQEASWEFKIVVMIVVIVICSLIVCFCCGCDFTCSGYKRINRILFLCCERTFKSSSPKRINSSSNNQEDSFMEELKEEKIEEDEVEEEGGELEEEITDSSGEEEKNDKHTLEIVNEIENIKSSSSSSFSIEEEEEVSFDDDDGKEEEGKGRLSDFFEKFMSFIVICDFRNCDFCYDMKHDVAEGEGPIRRRTKLGGCFSVVAVSLSIVFLIWSITDFVYGSKKISTSADFFHANETNQITGTIVFGVEFWGNDFTNCTSEPIVDGFHISSFDFYCDPIMLSSDSTTSGCSCEFVCYECRVTKSEVSVQIQFSHNNNYVRYIQYAVTLPSFYEEKYNLTGYFYEKNGSVDSASIDMALYKRELLSQSYWNLLLNLLDMEEFGESTETGIGTGILSIERESVYNLREEEYPGIVPFTFRILGCKFLVSIRSFLSISHKRFSTLLHRCFL